MNSLFTLKGKPFFTVGGQTHNSSTDSEESMERAWKVVDKLGLDTIAAPIYWYLIEPEEDKFCFDQIDRIISGARRHKVKVVLLWFGTWKNGVSSYVPNWIKLKKDKYTWVETVQHNKTRILSPLCEATKQADIKAFTKIMEYLKKVNYDETVLGIQIENEPGQLGSPRDYSELGEERFHSKVPADLISWVKDQKDSFIAGVWEKNGRKEKGLWQEVFGFDSAEIFTAYYFANYINEVSRAGKSVYPLTTYVNVWLGEMYNRVPGVDYPSGGAVSKLFDLWKHFSPDIDAICPDIYFQDACTFDKLASTYSTKDNIFYIPESAPTTMNALNVLRGITDYGLTGIHVFGIDSILDADGNISERSREYASFIRVIQAMKPMIVKYSGTGKLFSVAQYEGSASQYLDFGDFIGRVTCFLPNGDNTAGGREHLDTFHRDPEIFNLRGKGLIVYEGNGSFYLAGEGFKLMLIKKDTIEGMSSGVRASTFQNGRHQEFLTLSEGHFDEDGKFIPVRDRCGDECDYGIWVHSDIGVVHAVLEV